MASKKSDTVERKIDLPKKGFQSATVRRIKGIRRGNGDRAFQAHCIASKDGSSLYVTIRDTDVVLINFKRWIDASPFEDIYIMKVDEEYVFPEDDQPIATVGWKIIGGSEAPYISNIESKKKPEEPVTDKPTEAPEKTIDDFIPRCTAHEMPVVDELTGRCEQCEIEHKTSTPKHWSQSTDTFKKVARCFQKRKESATTADYFAAVKEWFDVQSMTEIDMTEDAFYAALEDELAARFDKAKNEKASEAPQNAPISQPSPPTPTQPTPPQIERSSSAGQSNESEVEEAQFVDKTPKDLTNIDQSTGEIVQDKPKILALTPANIMTEATTLTGVPVGQIAEYLNRPYKANSPDDNPYRQIQGPGGKKWTDLKGNYVRDRFDKVFGPHGIGWKIAPHPTLSKITCTPSVEKTNSGERPGFLCVMENYIFQYSIVVNGSLMWVDGSVLSDADFNADMGYAYRSAWTRIMKQALRSFGGFNHFIGKAG
jgi:hypothetical protein